MSVYLAFERKRSSPGRHPSIMSGKIGACGLRRKKADFSCCPCSGRSWVTWFSTPIRWWFTVFTVLMGRQAKGWTFAACSMNMVPMGLPFALLGALVGLLLGFFLEARSRRFEMEKRLLAVETLRQLMVTLAHHLLNAVQGIGGFASLAIRKEKDEDKRRPLEIIKREAIRIEATVKALQSLESVSTERYTKSSETLMIDIRKELQERIEALNKEQIEPPR